MTDHLPECPVERCCARDERATMDLCICERLRACEQRVLNAAQETVAAVREPYLHPQYDEAISDALAAIKALRGDK